MHTYTFKANIELLTLVDESLRAAYIRAQNTRNPFPYRPEYVRRLRPRKGQMPKAGSWHKLPGY